VVARPTGARLVGSDAALVLQVLGEVFHHAVAVSDDLAVDR